MKKYTYLFTALFSLTVILGCSENNTSSDNDSIGQEETLPINPKIETDYGNIGDYSTMDEYYLDNKNKKIWHGYRKNLYPTQAPKTVSFYEHGKLQWTETYDEVGNVLTSNR